MRKQRIEYDSPLDALVAITKRLSGYESRHGMTSEEFFDRYCKGQLDDDALSIDWANDYRHYLAIHSELEQKLRDAA